MPARRKSVKLSLKRQAIDWIATEGGGVPSRAEAHFRQRGWRVKAACFRRWWRQRDEILAATGSRRRLQGAGRRPVLGEAEDTLVDLIYDRRLKKEKVTRDWIAAQARLMFHESRTEEEHEGHPIRFAASDPWVTAFMQRNNLSLRRPWRQVPDSVVKKSIGKCGFHDDPDDWFIIKHDVYGAQFRQVWSAASLADQAADSSGANGDEVDELLDAFDEVWIED
ncbi:hypothetical protein PC115_g19907 [Phytophthora cactorum]|uniref:HTH CENPB-type domain-containing protein n=2 Tax=Phytophthora cactorum TaxID=29920 RepID=A0A8T1AX75_9STRA|nr:hypothetical protein PC115_g19907 [Phytophthora cactorum]